MSNIVYIKQNRCWTNSKKLAESFGKMHKDVLRKIQKQITEYPEDFRERNFALSLYNQEVGKGLNYE